MWFNILQHESKTEGHSIATRSTAEAALLCLKFPSDNSSKGKGKVKPRTGHEVPVGE
jgi:hypothetical protein